MDKKKIIGIILIAVLSITAVVSGVMFARQYSDSRKSKEAFNGLADLVVNIDTSRQAEPVEDTGTDEVSETDESAELTEEEILALQTKLAHEKYGALFEQNQDFIGWISIDGTNINYPVMQTPDNPDYYLKHSFEKSWSDYGVPYIDEACIMGISNNVVIYGHNMRNGSMFGKLPLYSDSEYWREHKFAEFDSLMERKQYVIFAAFYSADYDEYEEGFRYNADIRYKMEADQWLEEIRQNQIYDTGIDAQFGDEFITLTTCERSRRQDGRFVVVMRRIREGETFDE